MLPNMSYVTADRQYTVVNPGTGEIELFPAGYSGKREAMRRAVQFWNARLHQIVSETVSKWPQLEARAWRAADLVIRHGVRQADDIEAIASVTSSNEYGDYLVKTHGELVICDCLDYLGGGAPYIGSSGQRVCKHILAVHFVRRLSARVCDSCGKEVETNLIRCPHCSSELTLS